MSEDKAKASTIAKNKYNAKAYDSLRIIVKKGEKEHLQSHAAANGESLNAFVNRAIDEAMKHDVQGTPATEQVSPATPIVPNQFTLPLSQEELEQLNRHCIICLCKKPDFIREAIKEKIQRESPSPVPHKKESSPKQGKPTIIVRQTEDD